MVSTKAQLLWSAKNQLHKKRSSCLGCLPLDMEHQHVPDKVCQQGYREVKMFVIGDNGSERFLPDARWLQVCDKLMEQENQQLENLYKTHVVSN